ncbi:metabolite traffic protein EboE [Tunicatimonas pelagia]|uniref:metabolite traffic protein EboE n=1 Tax=Tunicatimonas pelagia TaxID=931531 RepID=UPI0026653C3A|nr:metabolite traffic protein EboE [Tunicatimonas pelagia]WKN41853.1 metabolite traffic protein EboE [Tunicatimonas pelagia]
MKLSDQHHLTYCTNIHPGESWEEVDQSLKTYVPTIKTAVAPDQPFGIGLRLSQQAGEELARPADLAAFQEWLAENNCYVFTMNGFPYGGFHRQVVKDQVHQPDWTTPERSVYTQQMFAILAKLLPSDMDGGISTSPLSYKYWHADEQAREQVFEKSTDHLVQIVAGLYQLRQETGKLLHLDIEPEPDGTLEDTQEVIDYFNDWLLPQGIPILQQQLGLSPNAAEACIKTHIQLCYDVCHFAVVYEKPKETFQRWQEEGIRIGKIQISAALKADLPSDKTDRQPVIQAFESLVESTYLHQVVARQTNGQLLHYPDLPDALKHISKPEVTEWRTHFHVPLFVPSYGVLNSTQDAIREVLSILNEIPVTQHLEVETYTWEVLPKEIQLGLDQSIIRELEWVRNLIN